MKWRKYLDIILTLNLLVLLGYGGYLLYSGVLNVSYEPEPSEARTTAFGSYGYVFGETLKAEVNRSQGVPIEGYVPSMVQAEFPGLALTDFENVETSVGNYVLDGGELLHVTPRDALLHSAATAISRRGFETLLKNVSTRLQINFEQGGTLTQVMDAISAK